MSEKTKKELEDKITDELPGENGWWKINGLTTYLSIGEELLNKGFSADEAYEILVKCFWAAVNERGG